MGSAEVSFAALVDRARRDGKHVMVAGIDAGNVGSIRFHERLGFVEVGRLREIGEKFGRRLDLVLMQLMLSANPACHAISYHYRPASSVRASRPSAGARG